METRTKIAVITGGSRGLGKNAALKIAEKGLDVILTYRSNREEAEATVHEIQSLGRKATAYQLDTKEVRSFDAFVKTVGDHLEENTGSRNIDYLINNAGTALYAPVADVTEEQLDDVVDIISKGCFSSPRKCCRSSTKVAGLSTYLPG